MKFERERWTPLTIVVETKEEAEVLHKILGLADAMDTVEDIDLYGLFLKLGEGLTHYKYEASGEVVVRKA